ncbi:MAG: hypothetical protein LBV23_07090 [Deltaproteobacteria bacterium]|jgi:hypothetical protein|nr:hypothetical protein [Deltaproteobacteria bacterium]
MSNVKLAVIVNARRELMLTAGEVPLDEPDKPEFEHFDEAVDTLEGPYYMKVGVASLGEVNLSGAEILNVAYPGDSLSISWYLPDEEEPESARPVNVNLVAFIPQLYPRPKASGGHVWRFKVNARGPYSETYVFQIGFQPPFKETDLTFYVADISAYGFNSAIVSRILYCYRAASYSESDWALPERVAEGLLRD